MSLDTSPAPATPDLETLHLDSGSHPSRAVGVCFLEAVAWFAGEPHTDEPTCVCPIIAEFGRTWNDSLPTIRDRDRLLKPLIPCLVGTRSTREVELKRSFLALDWLVRVCLPAWFDLTPIFRGCAHDLRSLPEIHDQSTLSQVENPLRTGRRVAQICDHESAMQDLIEDDAAAAAESASSDARRSTNCGALSLLRLRTRAIAAAMYSDAPELNAALQRTRATLQASAVDLLQRMIAVQAA